MTVNLVWLLFSHVTERACNIAQQVQQDCKTFAKLQEPNILFDCQKPHNRESITLRNGATKWSISEILYIDTKIMFKA